MTRRQKLIYFTKKTAKQVYDFTQKPEIKKNTERTFLFLSKVFGEKRDNKKTFYIFESYTYFLYFLAIILNIAFDPFQFYFQFSYFFSFFNWWFFIGLDGFSIYFIYLSTFLFFLCNIISNLYVKKNNFDFLFLLTVSNVSLFMLFFILDFFFFYFFFEIILIPFFLFFCFYSYGNRKFHASYLFFFFTLVGSLFMLFFIMYFFILSGTTDFFNLLNTKLTYNEDLLLSLLLFISLTFKIPSFPFHIWLPEAHVEAPTEGSIILAGILLKLSAYGFLRFYFPIFTLSNYYYTSLYNILFIISVIYICLITMRQLDIKRIIAYSSIFHMNIAFIALFVNNYFTQAGFYYMMISHAYISGALFFSIGILYSRIKEKHIFLFGELQITMPIFTFFFFIFVISNIGFPGTSGFISEILIFIGFTYHFKINFLIFLGLTAFISTAYNIILFSRIVFNIQNKKNVIKKDVNEVELILLVLFTLHIFILGLSPNVLLQYISLPMNIYFLNI